MKNSNQHMGSSIPYGSDGHRPIYEKDGMWKEWGIGDIYMGTTGLNKYVPKVGDIVSDVPGRIQYEVTYVDPISYVPTLVAFAFRNTVHNEILVSSTDSGYVMHFNKLTQPYFTLTPDCFLHTYAYDAMYARVHRGMVPDSTNVISRLYNNSGEFLGHDIPLVLSAVIQNSHDNISIRSIPSFNTNVTLEDGEVVTVVILGSSGNMLGYRRLLIDTSSYSVPAFSQDKYITGISLKSPHISKSAPHTIKYPIGMPIKTFNPIGVVHYSDNSFSEYPVDGHKFSLFGLDGFGERNTDAFVNSFAATHIGKEHNLTLRYELGRNEVAVGRMNYNNSTISEPYVLTVVESDRSYNVRLFVYPEWIGDKGGYQLKAYLLSVDRNAPLDVTPYIYIPTNSPSFQPLKFGTNQRLTICIQLDQIDVNVSDFLYVQDVEIVLRARPSDMHVSNIWEVATTSPSSLPFYGSELRARVMDYQGYHINIGNDIETLEEFLKRVYYYTDPLRIEGEELEPPVPTHISVNYGDESILIRVEEYNSNIRFSQKFKQYDNVEIVFYQESLGKYLALSVANMTIRG